MNELTMNEVDLVSGGLECPSRGSFWDIVIGILTGN